MKAIIFIGHALDIVRCKNNCIYQYKKWKYKKENVYFMSDYDSVDSETVQSFKRHLEKLGFQVHIEPIYL
jgi:ABC-type branched-subunit amino acid transport system substrate-binding protein